jgi:hypothetical protein
MRKSVESAMEIWKAGGGVAASEWQERASYGRGGYPIYRRRPTPVFTREMTRNDLELLTTDPVATFADYYRAVLANVTRRHPKVRKVIVVVDPVGLLNACKDAEIPWPAFNAWRDCWEVGNIVASQRVWQAQDKPRYVWQDLAKRLAPAPALGS